MTADFGPLENPSDLLTLTGLETQEITQALSALRPDWKLSQVRIERFLAGGYSNLNYRISYDDQRYVVRLPGPDSSSDFVAELGLLQALQGAFDHFREASSGSTVTDSDHTDLQPANFRKPEITMAQTVAAISERGWLLTRWVERPVLASVGEVSPVQLAQYLAGLHCRLQQKPIDDLVVERRSSQRAQSQVSADLVGSIMADLSLVYSEPSLQHVLREHLALLVKGTSTERVCHIDLNPWNLLFDGNNAWVTLDWETVALAPPLFDLVGLCDGYSLTRNFSQAHSTKLTQGCLVTYNELMKTSYPPAELAAVRTLFHWREYAWAAARLAQGRLRSTVLDDVLQQRRVYAKKLNEQAAALGVQLVLS